MKPTVDKINKFLHINPIPLTIYFLFVPVFLFSSFTLSFCKTINATSALRDSVLAAIQAAGSGDIILIPEGVASWSVGIEITKGLTILGAGAGKTVIRKSTSGYTLILDASHGDSMRLSGITLDGMNVSRGISLEGNPKNFRLDNCIIKNTASPAVQVFGYAYGVIDHNEFRENSTYDIVVYGDNDEGWNRPIIIGTNEAVYIEDNLFFHDQVSDPRHSIASNHGSRYVFRHNTITDVNPSNNTVPIDAHGNFYFGRGSVLVEIYENDIQSTHSYNGIGIRGGTGVIFNNRLLGDFTVPITLEEDQSFHVGETECGYVCCDYPCIDQVNNFYIWNNTVNNTTIQPVVLDIGLQREHILKDRDFFLVPKPGYVPYTYPHPLTQHQERPTPPHNLRIEEAPK